MTKAGKSQTASDPEPEAAGPLSIIPLGAVAAGKRKRFDSEAGPSQRHQTAGEQVTEVPSGSPSGRESEEEGSDDDVEGTAATGAPCGSRDGSN